MPALTWANVGIIFIFAVVAGIGFALGSKLFSLLVKPA